MELEAGDPVLQCGFCRTRLHVAGNRPLRYVLPHALDARKVLQEELVYLPFWRFRGLHFRALEGHRIRTSILDTTIPALPGLDPCASLGLRPQIVPLTMIFDHGPGLPGPSLDVRQAVHLAQKRTAALEDKRVLFERYVGEARHLIYAPYLREDRNKDAQGDLRPLFEGGRPLRWEPVASAFGNPRENTRNSMVFLPLICPECAHELPPHPWSVSYLCPGCMNNWLVQGKGLFRIPYKIMSPPGSPAESCFLPFWELRIRIRDMGIQTMAELQQAVMNYRKQPPGWDRMVPRLLIPAFKLNPKAFLKIASALSLSPDLDLEGEKGGQKFRPKDTVEPVRLHITEAAQAVKMVLAFVLQRKRNSLENIASTRIKVMGASLWYLPYTVYGMDLVQVHSGLAVPKQAVMLGRKI